VFRETHNCQVKYCINEWKTGKCVIGKKNTGFTEESWKSVYDAYLNDLKRWDAIAPVVTERIRRWFYEKARYAPV
jgi:hypothetical protein